MRKIIIHFEKYIGKSIKGLEETNENTITELYSVSIKSIIYFLFVNK
jgi:hypothetical protein